VLWLWDRLRLPRDRARELTALRRRLSAARRRRLDRDQRRRARELRGLREALLRVTGEAGACGQCARDRPPPHGRWPGGFCCGGQTEVLFTEAELVALAAAGTRPRQLRVPAAGGTLAGCVFRGPAGCSLPARHRPSICVEYVCIDLARDLHGRGRLDRVEALAQRLAAARERFAASLDAPRGGTRR
jgi:hypothetical protein